MGFITFHIYVIYHLPYLCDLSSSISMWSVTFHMWSISPKSVWSYHLPHPSHLSPSIPMRYITFHICVIYQYTKAQDSEPRLYKALQCVTCKFWICCFVLVICTEMWSTALELPFRGCTCTTACCCMYCWRTLICCSSWFSKMSVCGASGWFRIWTTELTLTPSLTAILYLQDANTTSTARESFHIYIQGVPKPMLQTSPGHSPPLIKQKSSYQHGSKSEQVLSYPLTFMCGYPLRLHKTLEWTWERICLFPADVALCAKLCLPHGSRRFGNVSWYRHLASCALPLAQP